MNIEAPSTLIGYLQQTTLATGLIMTALLLTAILITTWMNINKMNKQAQQHDDDTKKEVLQLSKELKLVSASVYAVSTSAVTGVSYLVLLFIPVKMSLTPFQFVVIVLFICIMIASNSLFAYLSNKVVGKL